MTATHRWTLILLLCSLGLAVLMQIPQILYGLQPASRGLLVHMNSDEHQYLARVQEVLNGRPEQAAQPYTGDPDQPGMHLGLIEQIEGTLFRWTELRAIEVEQIMDSISPVLLFLLVFFFCINAGFSRRISLLGSFLFTLPILYGLSRPIHQRDSFAITLTTILLLTIALKHRRFLPAIIGGLLLGTLVGVYLWSWMFAWAYVGLLFIWEGITWMRNRKSMSLSSSSFIILIIAIFCGLLAAIPPVLHLFALMRNPLYPDVAFRQGMVSSHLPESWILSTLFFGMGMGGLLAARTLPQLRGAPRFVILFPLAVFIVISQQLIHGSVLAFTSHETFAIALGAACSILLFFSHVPLRLSSLKIPAYRWLLLPLFCGGLVLAGTTHDNRYVYEQFTILPSRFSEQHLASALPILDALPRSVILSDIATSAFIADQTKHDILSSIYLESAMIPSEEIAQRWCMTVLPLDPSLRHISSQNHLVWPDANAAQHGGVTREREVKMVEDACAAMDQNPVKALKAFHVQYVLWDKERSPQWDLRRLNVPLEKVEEDVGWALYRM
ncbi:MAG: hypothetical protein WCG83_06560 [Candidatus Peregrinibacteria bacterium]